MNTWGITHRLRLHCACGNSYNRLSSTYPLYITETFPKIYQGRNCKPTQQKVGKHMKRAEVKCERRGLVREVKAINELYSIRLGAHRL